MRPHVPGRSSGRAPRPQGAAVGRTAGKVDGAGRRLRCRQRMAVTWSFKDAGLVCAVCADLAGLRFVKSGPRRSAGFAVRQRRSCGRKGRFLRSRRWERGGAAHILLGGWGLG